MADKDYNIDNSRYVAQAEQMKDLAERGVCAFCPDHIDNEHREPIELQTEHWSVTRNDYPYDDTSLHLLLIPKEHVNIFSDLSEAARGDFSNAIVQAERKWDLKHYAVAMRSGDFRYTGGTVDHLHAHIIVGDVENPDHEPVRFKLSSRPKA